MENVLQKLKTVKLLQEIVKLDLLLVQMEVVLKKEMIKKKIIVL
jgi:hypothetical protein